MSQGNSDVRSETNFKTLAFCVMTVLLGVAAVVGNWSSAADFVAGESATDVDTDDRRELERVEYLSQADAQMADVLHERWRDEERRRVREARLLLADLPGPVGSGNLADRPVVGGRLDGLESEIARQRDLLASVEATSEVSVSLIVTLGERVAALESRRREAAQPDPEFNEVLHALMAGLDVLTAELELLRARVDVL